MKLYLVGRRDLGKPGLLAAQLCHAMRQFSEEHPDVDKTWFECSNTLVLLEVSGERELVDLADSARAHGAPVSVFYEPDLDNAPTALAIGPEGRTLVRHLPLALG